MRPPVSAQRALSTRRRSHLPQHLQGSLDRKRRQPLGIRKIPLNSWICRRDDFNAPRRPPRPRHAGCDAAGLSSVQFHFFFGNVYILIRILNIV